MYRLRSLESPNMTSITTSRQFRTLPTNRRSHHPRVHPVGASENLAVPENPHIPNVEHNHAKEHQSHQEASALISPYQFTVCEEGPWTFFPRPAWVEEYASEDEDAEEDIDVEHGKAVAKETTQYQDQVGLGFMGLVRKVKSYLGLRVE
ncbi:hypothetical protein RUND412_006458 [Rhizina undulata]